MPFWPEVGKGGPSIDAVNAPVGAGSTPAEAVSDRRQELVGVRGLEPGWEWGGPLKLEAAGRVRLRPAGTLSDSLKDPPLAELTGEPVILPVEGLSIDVRA